MVCQCPMFSRVNHSQAVKGIVSSPGYKQASENAFSRLIVRFISLTPNLHCRRSLSLDVSEIAVVAISMHLPQQTCSGSERG